MTEFVTVDQVDAILGPDWAPQDKKSDAVYQANAYLGALQFKCWDAQPEAVTRAGAELARLAAQDKLYADAPPLVKRKKVKADTVETETEYVAGNQPGSGVLEFVATLLAPWLRPAPAVQFLRRV